MQGLPLHFKSIKGFGRMGSKRKDSRENDYFGEICPKNLKPSHPLKK